MKLIKLSPEERILQFNGVHFNITQRRVAPMRYQTSVRLVGHGEDDGDLSITLIERDGAVDTRSSVEGWEEANRAIFDFCRRLARVGEQLERTTQR